MSWTGRRVLVTGAGGFIGSHLAERLAREGARVRAFVHYNALSSWGWLDGMEPAARESVEIFPGDIRDAKRVEDAIQGCETVFHLAALISIPYSYQSPASYVDTNVGGTLNVLLGALRQGGVKVVLTSTSEVYGTPETVPIREEHPLKPQSPYAASKVGADKLGESFHCTYSLPVVILRPFNTYGPRQSARAVLPAILTQLLAGEKRISLGSLWPRRDLTYVDDTVEGFIRAAQEEKAAGKTIQLGTGRDISIGDLVQLAMQIMGKKAEVVSQDERKRPDKSEVERLLSDPSRAGEMLKWHPSVSLEEGIGRTAEWLRNNFHLYKTAKYLV